MIMRRYKQATTVRKSLNVSRFYDTLYLCGKYTDNIVKRARACLSGVSGIKIYCKYNNIDSHVILDENEFREKVSRRDIRVDIEYNPYRIRDSVLNSRILESDATLFDSVYV